MSPPSPSPVLQPASSSSGKKTTNMASTINNHTSTSKSKSRRFEPNPNPFARTATTASKAPAPILKRTAGMLLMRDESNNSTGGGVDVGDGDGGDEDEEQEHDDEARSFLRDDTEQSSGGEDRDGLQPRDQNDDDRTGDFQHDRIPSGRGGRPGNKDRHLQTNDRQKLREKFALKIQQIVKQIKPTEDYWTASYNVIKRIEDYCNRIFPDSHVECRPFGSYAQKTALVGSDVDLALVWNDLDTKGPADCYQKYFDSDIHDKDRQVKQEKVTLLKRLAKDIRKYSGSCRIVDQVWFAKIPLLKIEFDEHLEADISIGKSSSGSADYRIADLLKQKDWVLRGFIVVKHWVKKRLSIVPDKTPAFHGLLNSFSWVLLYLFFCIEKDYILCYEELQQNNKGENNKQGSDHHHGDQALLPGEETSEVEKERKEPKRKKPQAIDLLGGLRNHGEDDESAEDGSIPLEGDVTTSSSDEEDGGDKELLSKLCNKRSQIKKSSKKTKPLAKVQLQSNDAKRRKLDGRNSFEDKKTKPPQQNKLAEHVLFEQFLEWLQQLPTNDDLKRASSSLHGDVTTSDDDVNAAPLRKTKLSVRTGQRLPVVERQDFVAEVLWIEDPFENTNNAARSVRRAGWEIVRYEIDRAVKLIIGKNYDREDDGDISDEVISKQANTTTNVDLFDEIFEARPIPIAEIEGRVKPGDSSAMSNKIPQAPPPPKPGAGLNPPGHHGMNNRNQQNFNANNHYRQFTRPGAAPAQYQNQNPTSVTSYNSTTSSHRPQLRPLPKRGQFVANAAAAPSFGAGSFGSHVNNTSSYGRGGNRMNNERRWR
ncbi:unnamed protein product [Amoebophrya sp. A120]|nr:unnamed protein product [Amoebophrya sp. A120]|eukprot:GSA120T00008911001.1